MVVGTLAPCPRAETVSWHRRAIEKAVAEMHRRLPEPLTLRDLARPALMSPYHFNRVFRKVTGLPPRRFLAALRIDAAKRLLIETDLHVTDICFEVGYESLGSFITRFTQQVGVSPRALRHLAAQFARGFGRTPLEAATEASTIPCPTGGVRGHVSAPKGWAGSVFIGLFASNIPHGQPVCCEFRERPGDFRLGRVPDGRWHILAAALPRGAHPVNQLIPDARSMLFARRDAAISVTDGRCETWCELDLRPVDMIDPPILLALCPPAYHPMKSCARDLARLGRRAGEPARA
jgi:AraC family transcriptional regulator